MRELTLPEGITLTPAGERVPLVALDLLGRLKGIESRGGGWNGADTVDVLCEWFTFLGIDVDQPMRHWVNRPANDYVDEAADGEEDDDQ